MRMEHLKENIWTEIECRNYGGQIFTCRKHHTLYCYIYNDVYMDIEYNILKDVYSFHAMSFATASQPKNKTYKLPTIWGIIRM